MLTQATDIPILLMPRMETQTQDEKSAIERDGTTRVMAITDHLAGDHRLINVGAKLVSSGGKLLLAHVEDQYNLERFIAAIDKIAELDSDVAKSAIEAQLLSESRDFIESSRESIESAENVEIEAIVTVGHLMKDHRKLIEDNDVDLLILHTKDDDQLAMHGLAYPIAVELRHLPMLLL